MVEKIETPNNNGDINIIEYINKNAAALSIISAVIITIVANVLKIFAYVYYSGWFKYFNINKIYINISDKNFYSIAVSASVCIVFFVLNYIVYKIIVYQDKRLISLLKAFISIGVINTIFLYTGTDYVFYVNNLLAIFIVCFMIFPILEYSFGICLGIIILIRNKRNKNIKQNVNEDIDLNSDNSIKKYYIIIIMLIVLFSVYVMAFFYTGYLSAKYETIFRTIDNQFVVLYETDNYYIIAECTINSDMIIINKNKQMYIDKTDVTTESMKFSSVK